MPANVELSYRRVGEYYQGDLDGVAFTNRTFAEMMSEVHRRLTAEPAAGLLITRTDKAGLMPVLLDPPLLALLREDPVRYIKMHSVPDRVVDISGGKKAVKVRLVDGERYDMPKHSGLRVGHDTLADAFGDRVYLRLRGSKVEHPVTGRWVPLLDIERTFLPHTFEVLCVEGASGGWVTVRTVDLLSLDVEKLYLPRYWNSYGDWITKVQLQTMFDQFNKERADAVQQ